MKNIKTAALLTGLLFLANTGFCQPQSLYPLFEKKSLVRVAVALPTDVSEQKSVNAGDVKKELESALAARKSIRFQTLPSPEGADLTIDVQITEYYWTDHDPIDMLVGVGAAAMDAAMVENYARLQAVFTVRDAKTQKTLWNDKLMATITGGTLTKENGPAMIAKEMAQVFIRNCFGKKQRSR